MKQRTNVLWVVVGCAVVAGAVLALAMSAGAQFTFHRTVRRVVVDVVVTDKNGNPVHGLTRRDFTVYEDNRPQEMRSFEAFDLKADATIAPPPQPKLPPDTYMNVPHEPERGPLYIIVMDATNTGTSPIRSSRARNWRSFCNRSPRARALSCTTWEWICGWRRASPRTSRSCSTPSMCKRKDGHLPWVFLYGGNSGGSDPAWVFEVLGLHRKESGRSAGTQEHDLAVVEYAGARDGAGGTLRNRWRCWRRGCTARRARCATWPAPTWIRSSRKRSSGRRWIR